MRYTVTSTSQAGIIFRWERKAMGRTRLFRVLNRLMRKSKKQGLPPVLITINASSSGPGASEGGKGET